MMIVALSLLFATASALQLNALPKSGVAACARAPAVVLAVDDKVEVLSSEEGFAEAWAHAVIVSHYKGGEVVEYSKFVSSETGRNLKEKVRAL